MSILIVQRLALHQNGAEFRQQFNGAIRGRLIAPYDDVRRRLKFVTDLHTYIHHGKATHRARMPTLKKVKI